MPAEPNLVTAFLGRAEKFPTLTPLFEWQSGDITQWKVDNTMKILEAQSATLTNYEVYTHIMDQQARYKARHRMGKTAQLPCRDSALSRAIYMPF